MKSPVILPIVPPLEIAPPEAPLIPEDGGETELPMKFAVILPIVPLLEIAPPP